MIYLKELSKNFVNFVSLTELVKLPITEKIMQSEKIGSKTLVNKCITAPDKIAIMGWYIPTEVPAPSPAIRVSNIGKHISIWLFSKLNVLDVNFTSSKTEVNTETIITAKVQKCMISPSGLFNALPLNCNNKLLIIATAQIIAKIGIMPEKLSKKSESTIFIKSTKS